MTWPNTAHCSMLVINWVYQTTENSHLPENQWNSRVCQFPWTKIHMSLNNASTAENTEQCYIAQLLCYLPPKPPAMLCPVYA